MPAGYVIIPATTTGDLALLSQRVTLLGWSLMEDAGSPALASAYLRDGGSAGAAIVAAIKMPLSGTSQVWFGDIDNGGINLKNGLFLDMVAGSISGAIYIG